MKNKAQSVSYVKQINNLQNEILAEPRPHVETTATRTVVMSKHITHNPLEDFDKSN